MRKLRSMFIVGLLAGVLGSCAVDDEDPVPTDEPSTPGVSRPSPTATPPELGGFVDDFTSEGAAAFFHYFVDVMNYATVTGDLEEFDRLSAQTCGTCDAVADRIRRIYETGGYIVASEWSIARLATEEESGGVLLTVDLDIAAGEFAESSSDKTATRSKESNISINAWVTRDGDSWTIADFSAREDDE